MKYLPPQIGVCGRHRYFPSGDAGRRQQAFWVPLLGNAQIEVYRQSYEQNQNWYSVAKQANLALFSCL